MHNVLIKCMRTYTYFFNDNITNEGEDKVTVYLHVTNNVINANGSPVVYL